MYPPPRPAPVLIILAIIRFLRKWVHGPVYMTDGWRVWQYRHYHTRPAPGEGIYVGDEEWKEWCATHEKLVFYDDRIGWCLLKKEEMHRKGHTYYYWRAFKWPDKRRAPVRVYVGKLETITTEELRTKMRLLISRFKKKRDYYQRERDRTRTLSRRARKRRQMKRYRCRQPKIVEPGSRVGHGAVYPKLRRQTIAPEWEEGEEWEND